MFTSCPWFWGDPTWIEITTALAYASDAIGRVRRVTRLDIEPAFRAALGPAGAIYRPIAA